MANNYQIPSKNSAFEPYENPTNMIRHSTKSLQVNDIRKLELSNINGESASKDKEPEEGIPGGNSVSNLNLSLLQSVGAAEEVIEKEEKSTSGEEKAVVDVVVAASKRKCCKLSLELLGDEYSTGKDLNGKFRSSLNGNNGEITPTVECRNQSTPSLPRNQDPSCSLSCNQDQPPSSNNTTVEPNQREFLFEKILTISDVGYLNRLLIPRRFAEAYFPKLKIGEELYKREMLKFFDKQNVTWEMKFEFWPTSVSYVLTKGWKAFVNRYSLAPEYLIRFYKLEQQSDNNHYGIEYVATFSTFRLFGVNIKYKCLDGNNGDIHSSSDQRRISRG